MMNKYRLYLVSDILKEGKIGNLCIGSDQNDICLEFKDFSLNPIRMSKKSKIFLDTYKNIIFSLEDKKIISMQINFEDLNAESAVLNDLFSQFANINDWINFAEKYDWKSEKNASIHIFKKNNVFIYVNDQGELHLISIY